MPNSAHQRTAFGQPTHLPETSCQRPRPSRSPGFSPVLHLPGPGQKEGKTKTRTFPHLPGATKEFVCRLWGRERLSRTKTAIRSASVFSGMLVASFCRVLVTPLSPMPLMRGAEDNRTFMRGRGICGLELVQPLGGHPARYHLDLRLVRTTSLR